MINFNGTCVEGGTEIQYTNRGLNYGDAVFETIKASNGKLLFLEDHYFRLMASMRILRMEIPMDFTLEYFEEQLQNTLQANRLLNKAARVKILVYRTEGGKYLPNSNNIAFIVSAEVLKTNFYSIQEKAYVVDLYKDFYIAPGLLSTLKTNNKALNVIGSIYANENDLNNCLLLNTNKQVVEALNGNVFLVKGNQVKTPPLADGCLKGIMRKQFIELLEKNKKFDFQEASISPFELQQADELFITNVIVGIIPITKYRKKAYQNTVAKYLLTQLNVKLRIS